MKALTKSIIITLTGYIVGSTIGYFIIYPLFGLVITVQGILSLGLIFTALSFCTNYCSLKFIEYFERSNNA